METAPETTLLIKAAWSAAVVLGLTIVAERMGSRVAGLLSGAPLTAVLVFFFVGQDLGVDYVVARRGIEPPTRGFSEDCSTK